MGLVFKEPTAVVAQVRQQWWQWTVKSVFKSIVKRFPCVWDMESQVTKAMKWFILCSQFLMAKVGSCQAGLTPGGGDQPASIS